MEKRVERKKLILENPNRRWMDQPQNRIQKSEVSAENNWLFGGVHNFSFSIIPFELRFYGGCKKEGKE